MLRYQRWALLCLVALFAAHAEAASLTTCSSVQMTVDATYPNDPGFEHMYRYTLTGSWDVGRYGLSHLDVFLVIGSCACLCNPGIVLFPSPSGLSTGFTSTMGACTVTYTGSYLCKPDPSIPSGFPSPAIKFDTVENTCEAASKGYGSWVFYSLLPPGYPATYPGMIAVKSGLQVCTGDVTGRLPDCQCTTEMKYSTWGRMKAIYR